VGVIFSGRTLYRTSNRMFGGWGSLADPARGLMDAFVECGYSVDVLPDWKLDEMGSAWPLIVLPDWADVGPAVQASLARLAENGASVLIAGAANAALFVQELGVNLVGDARVQEAYVDGRDEMGTVNGLWQDVEPVSCQLIEKRYPAMDATRDGVPAATIRKVGKGQMIGVYGPLGTVFAEAHAPEVRRFLERLAARLFKPKFRLEAPPVIEAALRTKEGRTYLHLANATAMQVAADYAVADYIPACGPVRVVFPKRPKSVTLLPENRPLPVEAAHGEWAVTLPSIATHQALALDV
jgi:hypothetical protein